MTSFKWFDYTHFGRRVRQVVPWFCTPERVYHSHIFKAYCGMPLGYRCNRCGNGYQDHDPGDEG